MQSIEPDWNCQYSYFYIFLYFLYVFYWNLSNIKFRLYCFHKNFIKFITEIFKISTSTVVVIIWAEIWCWTWSECGCGRVVYCHECKCWLVPRSDLMDHITSSHREGSVSVGQTVLQARGIIHSRSRHTASCRRGRSETFCNSLIKFDILLLLLHKP